jgi:hydrogenase maturation protein HypF
VQGVGFRPFVHRLATAERLSGFVHNTGDGVLIEAEGPASAMERFLARLESNPPPHATVTACETTPLPPHGDHGFTIAPSTATQTGAATVTPDLATCADCLREVLDPTNRRYRYPFTTCVSCGPRYSVIASLPYDRARTSLRAFPLCTTCHAEYTDPASRRFHAETIACPTCGPQLAFWTDSGTITATRDAALRDAATALRDGAIIALKGLGGFQLLADATNDDAVRRLRARKQRPRKPFALMAASCDAAATLAEVTDFERSLLAASEAPIVLLRARTDATPIAASVARNTPCLGIMLPCTPLHHLLLRELPFPVVATSGNRGDEPIVTDETDALVQLAGIADVFLIHDRPILHRIDDSVVRVIDGREVVLRRARGYAPRPIPHAPLTTPTLALGGQQKSAIAIGAAGRMTLGPHIGDLTAAITRAAFADMIAELPAQHAVVPGTIACDTHPDYHSTQVAFDHGAPVTQVPHHLAHVLSGMIDNGLDAPVLGIAWDGTGDGNDGTIWGGECLAVTTTIFRRVAHLRPFRLPGGEAAMREPRRAALGLLHAMGESHTRPDLPSTAFTPRERSILETMLARGINAPLTSSAGRLFDAVASVLGLCQVASFEAEAAMAVEYAADRARHTAALPPLILRPTQGPSIIDWQPTLSSLIDQYTAGAAPEPLAAALHDALAAAIVDVARHAGVPRVLLTGGCFQNARLTECAIHRLRAAGFVPYWHHHIPPNDGGLAAGQLAFAAHPLRQEIN